MQTGVAGGLQHLHHRHRAVGGGAEARDLAGHQDAERAVMFALAVDARAGVEIAGFADASDLFQDAVVELIENADFFQSVESRPGDTHGDFGGVIHDSVPRSSR